MSFYQPIITKRRSQDNYIVPGTTTIEITISTPKKLLAKCKKCSPFIMICSLLVVLIAIPIVIDFVVNNDSNQAFTESDDTVPQQITQQKTHRYLIGPRLA